MLLFVHLVLGPTVNFLGADSWALGPNCGGPNLLRAHSITKGSWQIGPIWALNSRAPDNRTPWPNCPLL